MGICIQINMPFYTKNPLAFSQCFVALRQGSVRICACYTEIPCASVLVENLFHMWFVGVQERLMKKLGSNAYPFFFELPPHCPASVTLQPAPGDTGQL